MCWIPGWSCGNGFGSRSCPGCPAPGASSRRCRPVRRLWWPATTTAAELRSSPCCPRPDLQQCAFCGLRKHQARPCCGLRIRRRDQQPPRVQGRERWRHHHAHQRHQPLLQSVSTFHHFRSPVLPLFLTFFSGRHHINFFSWTIKARITSKSDIRRWSNAKGEGTLFSIDLLDNEGGEIRATFFKDACEKFFPVLEEGKVRILDF